MVSPLPPPQLKKAKKPGLIPKHLAKESFRKTFGDSENPWSCMRFRVYRGFRGY